MTRRKLTNDNVANVQSIAPLARIIDKPFIITIALELHSKYNFSCMSKNGLKDLDKFIEETVGKRLTISEVDKLFLRTKGQIKYSEKIDGIEREVIHYGKNRKPFRIFGFYNEVGHFVVYRIDCNHNFHKCK